MVQPKMGKEEKAPCLSDLKKCLQLSNDELDTDILLSLTHLFLLLNKQ